MSPLDCVHNHEQAYQTIHPNKGLALTLGLGFLGGGEWYMYLGDDNLNSQTPPLLLVHSQ